MSPDSALGSMIVIAKRPAPGRVKTRLSPPLSATDAALVAAACLTDTLAAASAVPSQEHLLAIDEPTDEWCPDGWRQVRQVAGGLDLRLAAAFDAAAHGPALLVGMDTPQFRPEHVTGFDAARFDACIGLAADGGFWAIGFADPATARSVIPGVAMSTDHTGADQLSRMIDAGMRVQRLQALIDVDTVQSAAAVAGAAPDTRFAAMFADCLARSS